MRTTGTRAAARDAPARGRDAEVRSMLRRANSTALERYGIGGREKVGGHRPRPISLPVINLPDIAEGTDAARKS